MAPLSAERQKVMQEVSRIAKETPGVSQVITITGVSALDNNSTLANAGVAYIMAQGLERARQGRGPRGDLQERLNQQPRRPTERHACSCRLLLPIQGIGNAGGFTHADRGSRRKASILAKLQASANAVVKVAEKQSGIQRVWDALPGRGAAIQRGDRP